MAIQVSKRIIRFVLFASVLLLSVVYIIGQTGYDNYGTASSVETISQENSVDVKKPVVPQDENKKDDSKEKRVKACFVSLVRNGDLDDLTPSIKMVEDRFNKKYNYPWVFLNDVPFTDEFKKRVTNVVSGEVKFGVIPKEHWSVPSWIDEEKAEKLRKQMAEDKVIYGGSLPYRHMCRFESGFFWRHPLLDEYDWYWRVEPSIKIYCDVEYDVFKWMENNNKVYGFTISIKEFEKTIPTLWQTTKDFMKKHPEHVSPNNMMDFVSNDKGQTYNLCHFWSNFEIASLNFWRSKAYRDYFEYLDQAGGFFYERWGDAPVHSIAASLFLNSSQIHHFADFGYYHGPYHQCPRDDELWKRGKCDCKQSQDFTFEDYSCGKTYYKVNNLKMPPGV